jgi:hypothetical protein
MMAEMMGQMFSRRGGAVIVKDVMGRSRDNMNAIIHLSIWTFFYREQKLLSRGHVCSGLCALSEPHFPSHGRNSS